MQDRTASPPLPAARSRARWVRQLHQWHWISSAICLVGMILFAVTGITLNHAGQIEARPSVTRQEAQLPDALLQTLNDGQTDAAGAPLPAAVRDWLRAEMGLRTAPAAAEWSADEVYLPLPRPGGDAWLRIDRELGEVEYERTDRGWISWLNDLHKGRHTGAAWSWFIDIFSVACLVFSVTGLLLLKAHAANRGMTWPLVAGGLALPAALIVLFVH
ncbi:MAG: PepSY-associated TM helix domain-containing protein [Rhodocyclaceae bacterium]|nr:PepSY-associated TM helix domain-containing protein [Rhodocyclaceae bacterium]